LIVSASEAARSATLRVEAPVFVLCDVVGRDAHSGKWMLTGLFDTVLVPRFPAQHPTMDLFFRLWVVANGTGETAASAPLSATVSFRTPSGQRGTLPAFALTPGIHGLVEGSLRVQNFPLPEPGAYELELLVGGLTVARTWLRAEALPDRRSTPIQ